MSALKAISEALKLVDAKKESLKRAFEDLEAHSHLLSSFHLNWPDLDSHFASAHASLTRRFHRLHADHPIPAPANAPADSPDTVVPARPALKVYCENMDGRGLRSYIAELLSERTHIKHELPDAIQSAPDPAALVLEAVEGFYRESESGGMSRVCELLLETLMCMKPICSVEVRERAKKVALEWKGNVDSYDDPLSLPMGVLLMVAAYQLAPYFDVDHLVDCLVVVCARHRQTSDMIRSLGLVDKVPDLIQKLISKGKQLLAVKFVFEFNLMEKFPPIPLLKTYIKVSAEAAKQLCVAGNNSLKSLNEATDKESSALRSVIKMIEVHKLEGDYPKDKLEKKIEQLEREKANRKRPGTTAPGAIAKQQNGSKRQRSNAMNVVGGIHHLQQVGLQPERHAAGPYGLVGASRYGAEAEMYGVGGVQLADPYSYSHTPASYGMQPTQYHRTYYPQL